MGVSYYALYYFCPGYACIPFSTTGPINRAIKEAGEFHKKFDGADCFDDHLPYLQRCSKMFYEEVKKRPIEGEELWDIEDRCGEDFLMLPEEL